jgi:hypothetical protein
MQTLFHSSDDQSRDQQPDLLYPCDNCRVVAPTKYVEFRQNIGVLVVRFPSTVTGSFCKRCIQRQFWKMTLVSLTCGWWGYISFFATIGYTVGNIYYYVSSLTLEAPAHSGYATEVHAASARRSSLRPIMVKPATAGLEFIQSLV